ncbi:MAG: Hsp20 family protein [Azospirillaceae bacterium]|nr:Hsp20 family protein [Azospirillaceae bacterium]
MRAVDFSPFSRSSVGFDRMFRLLEDALQFPESDSAFPAYDIKTSGDSYRIELAVPGFAPDSLSVTVQQNLLIVAGRKTDEPVGDYLYRGIADAGFERRFNLADFVAVTGAALANGILTIDLRHQPREVVAPRRITISAAGRPATAPIEGKAA